MRMAKSSIRIRCCALCLKMLRQHSRILPYRRLSSQLRYAIRHVQTHSDCQDNLSEKEQATCHYRNITANHSSKQTHYSTPNSTEEEWEWQATPCLTERQTMTLSPDYCSCCSWLQYLPCHVHCASSPRKPRISSTRNEKTRRKWRRPSMR